MSSKNVSAWLAVAGTILFTVYGQVVIKWQMGKLTGFPGLSAGWPEKGLFYLNVLLKPWIVSAYISAFFASLLWLVAMRRLPISTAYPFMALSFVFVICMGMLLFNESLRPLQIVGVACVLVGVALVGAGS